jgi:hypothetical protein
MATSVTERDGNTITANFAALYILIIIYSLS